MTAHVSRLPVTADPLIAEANRRKCRRRLLLALLLAGVVVLTLGLTTALRSPGSRAGGAWLPQGVQEIDIHAPSFKAQWIDIHSPNFKSPPPPLSLRITDPSQVARIAAWFNALVRSPREKPRMSDGDTGGCTGGPAADVAFTFRGANGAGLATANSTPDTAWYCEPIQFTAGARPRAFLLDGFARRIGDGSERLTREHASSLIGRVERLLGVKFTPHIYYSR